MSHTEATDALRSNGAQTIPKEGDMSSPTVTVSATQELAEREESADRYAGVEQYSLAQIVGVWAAAAVPMAILAWVVAPPLADRLSGTGDIPMMKSLLLLLTAGLIWQFVLVALLVWHEQRTFRWSTVRDALWLRLTAESEERPRRREVVADPDPADRPLRPRGAAPGRRRARRPRPRQGPRLGRRQALRARSCYPARRYQSAWIGIIVHSAQSVFFAVIVLTLVV